MAWAQTAETLVVTGVVTGTRLGRGLDPQSPALTVIDSDQIAARQASSFVDLLSGLPGLAVQQAGGRGSVVSLFTRGAKPNFTVIMVNGVKINDPINTRGGSVDLSTFALDGIERVEVLRGPASAIYGSDAMGGVVNIITSSPTSATQGRMDAEFGSDGFGRAAARLSGEFGGMKMLVGGGYVDNGAPVDGSLYRSTHADSAIAFRPSQSLSLRSFFRYDKSRAGAFPDSSGGPLLAVIRRTDQRHIDEVIAGINATYDLSAHWGLTLDYGLFDRGATTQSPGVAPGLQTPSGIPASGDQVSFQRNAVTAVARYTADERMQTALGVEFLQESGNDQGRLDFGRFSLPTSFMRERATLAGFGQVDIALTPTFALTASLRADGTDEAGTKISPQLSARYNLAATDSRIDVTWAHGFKTPSFYALGNPLVGDPKLRPEYVEHYSVGLVQTLPGLPHLLKLSLYKSTYTDLIDFRPGAVPKLVNLSRAYTQGGDISLDAMLAPDFRLSLYGSYTDAVNEATNKRLRNVPRWLGGAQLRWMPLEPLQINLAISHAGALVDNSVPIGDLKLAGHTRLDLAASWKIDRIWTASFAADNLLNAHYQEVIGFPAPSTQARAGIKAAF